MKSMSSTSLYAAIDLGSNSFHMLVVREVAGSIQTLSRIKRKVRLAAGLNSDNTLSAEAMERAGSAYACLPSACRIFRRRKSASWPPPRCVLPSMRGVSGESAGDPRHSSASDQRRRRSAPDLPVSPTPPAAPISAVVDIGGASTELVTGTGAQTTSLFSLSMGCVTANAILPTVV